jgi:hypothetical protein
MDTLNLVDTAAAAKLLGVSKSLLDHDRLRPMLRVPYIRLGASVRYDPQALRAWATARMVHGTETQAPPEPKPEPPRRGRTRKKV